MKPFSTELPDRVVQIADDAEAKRFIFALGVWDRLVKDATLERSDSTLDHDETAWVGLFTHPTHWILCGRVHNDEMNRGYVVFGWPRNKWPETVIDDFLAKMPMGDSPIIRTKYAGDIEPPPQS